MQSTVRLGNFTGSSSSSSTFALVSNEAPPEYRPWVMRGFSWPTMSA